MKTMMKLFALTLALLMLAGCSSGSAGPKEVDLGALVEELKPFYTDEMLALDDSTLTEYYDLSLDDVAKYVVQKSAGGASAEELALFEAVSDDAAKALEEAVLVRVDDQKFNYEAYLPAEMPKLENAVVIREGRYVFFACVDDDAAARVVLEGALK